MTVLHCVANNWWRHI